MYEKIQNEKKKKIVHIDRKKEKVMRPNTGPALIMSVTTIPCKNGHRNLPVSLYKGIHT